MSKELLPFIRQNEALKGLLDDPIAAEEAHFYEWERADHAGSFVEADMEAIAKYLLYAQILATSRKIDLDSLMLKVINETTW